MAMADHRNINQRVQQASASLEQAYNTYMNVPAGNIRACEDAQVRIFDVLTEVLSILSEVSR
jgi:hypothetical protein